MWWVGHRSQQYGVDVLLPWLQTANSGILLDLKNRPDTVFTVVSLVVAFELQSRSLSTNSHTDFWDSKNLRMNRSNPQILWLGCLSFAGSFGTICYRSVPIGSHRNISKFVPSISYFSFWLLTIPLVYNHDACEQFALSSSIIQIPEMIYNAEMIRKYL